MAHSYGSLPYSPFMCQRAGRNFEETEVAFLHYMKVTTLLEKMHCDSRCVDLRCSTYGGSTLSSRMSQQNMCLRPKNGMAWCFACLYGRCTSWSR